VQRIWFTSALAPPEVRLVMPDNMGEVEVLQQGEWSKETRTILIARDANEKRPFKLRYTFPALAASSGNGGGSVLAMPLPVPIRDARCRTQIRISCESAALVERVGGPWEELNLEPDPDAKRWPSLVLGGERPDQPPRVRLANATALAVLGFERALIRVRVEEHGQQNYHASFLLNPSGTRHVDFEFPVPPATLGLKVAIDGLAASWGPVGEGTPRPASGDPARVARVPSASGQSRKSVLVDLWYQLTPNQLGASNSAWTRTFGSLQTV